LMTPSDENETRQLLHTGLVHEGPAAVRYPRGSGSGAEIDPLLHTLPMGKGRVVRERKSASGRIAILNFGTLLPRALQAAQALDATVADMRFVKPLDEDLIRQLAEQHDLLVTLEENAIAGGAGSAVCEWLNQEEITMPVLQLGLPDKFVDHGSRDQLLEECGLDAATIERSITGRVQRLVSQPGKAAQSF
jgi:1-deoxy-D-xylulose-5-phosphate synthase